MCVALLNLVGDLLILTCLMCYYPLLTDFFLTSKHEVLLIYPCFSENDQCPLASRLIWSHGLRVEHGLRTKQIHMVTILSCNVTASVSTYIIVYPHPDQSNLGKSWEVIIILNNLMSSRYSSRLIDWLCVQFPERPVLSSEFQAFGVDIQWIIPHRHTTICKQYTDP